LGVGQKQTELDIKRAELKILADGKKAEADAAYEIQSQEQRKSIETATVNAEIAKTQREAELKQYEVEVQKQKLEAEIRAKADAERYRQQQEAEAALYKRQKDAEAKRYEQEQEAEAERKSAEAQKFAREQEAEGIAAVGKAEAEAIRAKALAEAEGIDKKAEAMKKYGEAAVIEMVMQALPEIARNVAEPLSKVDKITMYGAGNSAKLLEDIVTGATQVTEGITQGMGIDVKSLIAGMLGGRLAGGEEKTIIVQNPPSPEPSGSAPQALEEE
ncbi:MAG: flotillin family protein, partial [Dysosmobacter sp.]|nr:flotillin family protein [Dysosmobacter sp.]